MFPQFNDFKILTGLLKNSDGCHLWYMTGALNPSQTWNTSRKVSEDCIWDDFRRVSKCVLSVPQFVWWHSKTQCACRYSERFGMFYDYKVAALILAWIETLARPCSYRGGISFFKGFKLQRPALRNYNPSLQGFMQNWWFPSLLCVTDSFAFRVTMSLLPNCFTTHLKGSTYFKYHQIWDKHIYC